MSLRRGEPGGVDIVVCDRCGDPMTFYLTFDGKAPGTFARCDNWQCWPTCLATNFYLIGKVCETHYALVHMDYALEHCVCGAHEKSEFAQLKRELSEARVGDALVQNQSWDDSRTYCAVIAMSEFLHKFIGRRFVDRNAIVSMVLNHNQPPYATDVLRGPTGPQGMTGPIDDDDGARELGSPVEVPNTHVGSNDRCDCEFCRSVRDGFEGR